MALERIMVIGAPGSGKSWMAKRIASRLDLPLVQLDREYWQPGWTPTPQAQWLEKIAALTEKPRWVMDGNYAGTIEVRIPKADVIVVLDLPRWFCMASLMVRTLSHIGRTRPSMAPGCPERFDLKFFIFAWRSREAMRAPLQQALERLRPEQRGFVLTSRAQAAAFAAGLPETLTHRSGA